MDEAYLGALLIDMGKIVLINLHPAVMAAIEAFCAEKKIGSELLEELLDGANHAEIGALLAERWQFPPALVATIRWHHHPGGAPRGLNEVRLHVVGLAACLVAIDYGEMAWDQVGQDLRRRFNITREDQVVALRAAMREVLA
jgi:HD-like signal output (HDOD) protein